MLYEETVSTWRLSSGVLRRTRSLRARETMQHANARCCCLSVLELDIHAFGRQGELQARSGRLQLDHNAVLVLEIRD
jgi:hypothetical protein